MTCCGLCFTVLGGGVRAGNVLHYLRVYQAFTARCFADAHGHLNRSLMLLRIVAGPSGRQRVAGTSIVSFS
jgi:hypothetical protein